MRRVWRRYVRAELRSVLGRLMWCAKEKKQSCAVSSWCSQVSMLISQEKIIKRRHEWRAIGKRLVPGDL